MKEQKMNMTPDEILARIMPKWDEFCKTKEWKKFIVNDGTDCDYCQLSNPYECGAEGCSENCPYPLMDGKHVAVTPDDGGFLIQALREMFPETGMTEDEFFERLEYCSDNGLFDFGEYACYQLEYSREMITADAAFPSIEEAREYMDIAIRTIVSTVFDQDVKMDEEENSET